MLDDVACNNVAPFEQGFTHVNKHAARSLRRSGDNIGSHVLNQPISESQDFSAHSTAFRLDDRMLSVLWRCDRTFLAVFKASAELFLLFWSY